MYRLAPSASAHTAHSEYACRVLAAIRTEPRSPAGVRSIVGGSAYSVQSTLDRLVLDGHALLEGAS